MLFRCTNRDNKSPYTTVNFKIVNQIFLDIQSERTNKNIKNYTRIVVMREHGARIVVYVIITNITTET